MSEAAYKEYPEATGVALDFKRVLFRALRYWWLTVLCLLAALAMAFYKNRYSQRIYTIGASILIRETEETAGGELLYKNALIDQYRNYLNEPYIIKSYPLIQSVVEDLGLHVSFYREGYFMTTEAYDYAPIRARLCGNGVSQYGQLLFKLVDQNTYALKASHADADWTRFTLGDSVLFNDFDLCVRKIEGKDIMPFIDVPFLLNIQNPRNIAASYIGRLDVKWLEEGSGVIGLSITGANPKKEVDFLTGLIRIYQQADLERKRETADRTIEFIDSQLRVIQDSLKRVEQSLADFGLKASRQNISLEAQRLLDQLSTIASEQTILTVRDRYFSYLHEQFSNSETSDNIILPASVGIVDPVFNSLIQRWVEIQSQARMHKVNPLVQLKKDEAVLIKAKVIESVQALVDADRIKSTLLTQQTRETERLLNLLPATERKLVGVQRNYTLLENLYVFLMQKSSEAGISKAATTSDIQVVNPPMQGGAIAPKPRQNYTIAIFAGLLIPFLFFVFVELIDNKVQSKEDIERLTTIPFVGGIGHNQMESNLIVSQKPKSGVAESFRALRSNLNYFTGGQAKKVFMVSSSISGEGKTFTTINLATVFALSGKRTLIVGADMRRPKIFQDFNCDNTAGLTTFLSGLTSFENIVQPTEIANLSLVSGGPVPPNPSELLLTDRFQQFITEALNQFDFVLIDTPPLALVTDAFVISKYVDHTVFVVRQNYTPKEFIKSIDEYYRSEKIKNISILLNDIYKSGLGYGYGASYAYQYGYSYGYGYGRKKKNGEGYYDET